MARFRFVSSVEFTTFLRGYPRPLTPKPPPLRRAIFRSYLDPAMGEWPDNVVAKEFHSRRSAIYEVREDLLNA